MPIILLPPPIAACPVCAMPHTPGEAHNADSQYYKLRFAILHGRPPSWADAIAHCTPQIRDKWTRELLLVGVWSEPAAGKQVIAEPQTEAIRMLLTKDGDAIEAFVPFEREVMT